MRKFNSINFLFLIALLAIVFNQKFSTANAWSLFGSESDTRKALNQPESSTEQSSPAKNRHLISDEESTYKFTEYFHLTGENDTMLYLGMKVIYPDDDYSQFHLEINSLDIAGDQKISVIAIDDHNASDYFWSNGCHHYDYDYETGITSDYYVPQYCGSTSSLSTKLNAPSIELTSDTSYLSIDWSESNNGSSLFVNDYYMGTERPFLVLFIAENPNSTFYAEANITVTIAAQSEPAEEVAVSFCTNTSATYIDNYTDTGLVEFNNFWHYGEVFYGRLDLWDRWFGGDWDTEITFLVGGEDLEKAFWDCSVYIWDDIKGADYWNFTKPQCNFSRISHVAKQYTQYTTSHDLMIDGGELEGLGSGVKIFMWFAGVLDNVLYTEPRYFPYHVDDFWFHACFEMKGSYMTSWYDDDGSLYDDDGSWYDDGTSGGDELFTDYGSYYNETEGYEAVWIHWSAELPYDDQSTSQPILFYSLGDFNSMDDTSFFQINLYVPDNMTYDLIIGDWDFYNSLVEQNCLDYIVTNTEENGIHYRDTLSSNASCWAHIQDMAAFVDTISSEYTLMVSDSFGDGYHGEIYEDFGNPLLNPQFDKGGFVMLVPSGNSNEGMEFVNQWLSGAFTFVWIFDHYYSDILKLEFESIDQNSRPSSVELVIPGAKAYINDLWGIEAFASIEYFDKVEFGVEYFVSENNSYTSDAQGWMASYFGNDKDFENPTLIAIRVFDIESLDEMEDPCIDFAWFGSDPVFTNDGVKKSSFNYDDLIGGEPFAESFVCKSDFNDSAHGMEAWFDMRLYNSEFEQMESGKFGQVTKIYMVANSPVSVTYDILWFYEKNEDYLWDGYMTQCFGAEEEITYRAVKKNLQKPMKEVQLGDEALAMDTHGKVTFAPIKEIPHSANSIETEFLVVTVSLSPQITNTTTETTFKDTTVESRTLRLTAGHLLPSSSDKLCASYSHIDTTSYSLKMASEIQVGDCLLVVEETKDGTDMKTYPAAVTKIDKEKGVGIYSAATKESYIVVNGIVASPYALDEASMSEVSKFVMNRKQPLKIW